MLFRVHFHDESHKDVHAIDEIQARREAIEMTREEVYGDKNIPWMDQVLHIIPSRVEVITIMPHEKDLCQLADDGCPHHE